MLSSYCLYNFYIDETLSSGTPREVNELTFYHVDEGKRYEEFTDPQW